VPEELAAVNGQDELNVHDAVEVQGKFNVELALLAWRRVDAGK
jgi:hypothetical protein